MEEELGADSEAEGTTEDEIGREGAAGAEILEREEGRLEGGRGGTIGIAIEV